MLEVIQGLTVDKSIHSDIEHGTPVTPANSVISRRTVDGFLNVGCFGRICRIDYLSMTGKWLTFSKLMTYMLIPVLAGWAFVIYSLVDNVQQSNESLKARDTMLKAVDLGMLIYKIQKERDMSILYLSKIGPGTKTFVIQEYEHTNNAVNQMWAWPEEFAGNSNPHFRSKGDFFIFLNQHRAKLNIDTSEMYDEIVFYTEIIDFIMDWMVESITLSGFGNIWKILVVFNKVTRCILDTGIERAYGTMFFTLGAFSDPNYYDFYFERIHRFKYSYTSASYYSIDLVDPYAFDRMENTKAINHYRDKIKTSNFTGLYKSALDAEQYFDNLTERVEFLFKLQGKVGNRVVREVNLTVIDHAAKVIIYGLIATIVFIACPVIAYLFENLTSLIHRSSNILTVASHELNMEKRKTYSLLYQMLPVPVVERLKVNAKVEPEYFRSCTIMFSSVANFTVLSIELTAMELVKLLNILYTSFDEKIGKYDVYKVETINDTYMVVSGVPIPNGCRHATEIAYLALDIRRMISHAMDDPVTQIPVQLLVGINTGSVSAGIVGTSMPRYCLFGDTVNIASRMKSYSKPNRIHVSCRTYKNLARSGCFILRSRGDIDIKGKGEMETFWLLGTAPLSEQTASTSKPQLKGHMDEYACEIYVSSPERPDVTPYIGLGPSPGIHSIDTSTGDESQSEVTAKQRPSKSQKIKRKTSRKTELPSFPVEYRYTEQAYTEYI